MTARRLFTLALVATALGAGGCKKAQQTTNADLAEAYDQHHYDDMVTTEEYETHEDQGASISPRELEFIQQTIEEYRGDFEHCLEAEMDRLENRWVAGNFVVEFHISTKGKVSEVKVLEEDVKERRTEGPDGTWVSEGGKPARVADQFGQCVHDKLLDWEFDPPPETDYVHTYNGQVGEAW